MSTSLGAGAPHADVSCCNYVTANLTLYSFGLVSQQQLGILVNQVLQMLSCHLCGMSTSWELQQLSTTKVSQRYHVGRSNFVAAFCRQALVGGYYGLLNWTNIEPNPDYYTAILWRQYMGINVLGIQGDASATDVRVYAHCGKYQVV